MGGLLVQDTDDSEEKTENWISVTNKNPSNQTNLDLNFAWKICKHVKSNAIVIAKDQKTIGIGAGQMNRVGAAKIALEAAGSLHEGMIYGLSLPQLAESLDAKVLIVNLWEDCKSVDALLDAKKLLGEKLAGVVLNGVLPQEVEKVKNEIIPSLKDQDIEVFGVMPKSPLLRSVTVGELVRRLDAQVICCPEKDQLLVETLSIGAMGVNSAMEFFRRRRNMAVVTGADRTDIQLAALEASTQCLILTGLGDPLSQLIHRAEELEVPILKVGLDTLSSVEIIEQAFGHVRIHESIKASYAVQLVQEHVNLKRILEKIDFSCKFSDKC